MSKHELDLGFFSKKLKHLIKINNVKNIDLANYLGCSKGVISNYISGNYVPKLETVIKIVSYFGVNFEYLIKEVTEECNHLNEIDKIAYNIPTFLKDLNSDKIIYRNDNFIGHIISPLPLPVSDDTECYAVKIYDDSMNSFGIIKDSIAIFSPTCKAKNGDISAVFIKSKKQIFVRSIEKDKKTLKLISDDVVEEYKIEKNNCDAIILGKVILATFDPNQKRLQ